MAQSRARLALSGSSISVCGGSVCVNVAREGAVGLPPEETDLCSLPSSTVSVVAKCAVLFGLLTHYLEP